METIQRRPDEANRLCDDKKAALLPLTRFRAHLHGIVASASTPAFSKASTITNAWHGYRDDACLFLKIRVAFPGIP